MCIYRNTAYKVWETDTPHCKGQDSNQGIVHTAPPAQSQVQQEGQLGKLLYAKKKKKTPKNPKNPQTIHQVSLAQTAKGGRGMPGSNGCHYSNFLARNYQHKKEQFCEELL